MERSPVPTSLWTKRCVIAAANLGVTLEEALRMASLYPAAFLKLDHEQGRVAQGYLANLVHLDDSLAVRETWIEGSSSAEEP